MITDVNMQALADYIIEGERLKKQVTALESALDEAKVALEYVGCHEHDFHETMPCKFCTVVDNALDTIRKLKESK